MLCTRCKKHETEWYHPRHVYIIHKRGLPLHEKPFCSLECLTAELAEVDPSWTVVGGSFSGGDGGKTVHCISLADNELVEARIKYRG
jgi:hypothetical protein